MTTEEAINELEFILVGHPETSARGQAVLMAIKALEKLEQKNGKWLSHYEYCKRKGYIPSGLNALWWCDLCEQGVEHPTNYCPNCGAYMETDE